MIYVFPSQLQKWGSLTLDSIVMLTGLEVNGIQNELNHFINVHHDNEDWYYVDPKEDAAIISMVVTLVIADDVAAVGHKVEIVARKSRGSHC